MVGEDFGGTGLEPGSHSKTDCSPYWHQTLNRTIHLRPESGIVNFGSMLPLRPHSAAAP
jgi:hypothetical protein